MKKTFLRGSLLLGGLILFTWSCSDDEAQKAHIDPELTYEKTEYNLSLLSFAKAVGDAMNDSKGFRSLIHTETLKQFDGDYDVLIKNVIDKTVPAENGRSELTVRSLLLMHSGNVTTGARTDQVIDQLLDENPCLQIAVPIHAEEWDPDVYSPEVAIMPEEYLDSETEFIPGYNQHGELIAIDAVNEPSVPVIVVSQNERTSCGGFPDPPISYTPYSLQGSETETGIRLNWQISSSAASIDVSGYRVYKKGSSNPTFIQIAMIAGLNNRVYDDNNVEPNQSYSYYVTSYTIDQLESNGSNIVSVVAPNRPNPVLEFDAKQYALNEIELTWQNDNSQFYDHTLVSRRIVGSGVDYQPIGTFDGNDHSYLDTDFGPGQEIIYKAQHVSILDGENVESNPKYDIVKTPYRDMSTNSPVYIKQIKFSDWKLERWPAGKPEFYIGVNNVDHVSGTSYKVQEQINCQFNSRKSTSQFFFGKKVLDWRPGFWYDMLTFTAVEYDRPSGNFDFKVSVGYNAKNLEKTGITAQSGIEGNINFQDKGEKCGSQTYSYFDPKDYWIEFPNYGVKINVVEVDD